METTVGSTRSPARERGITATRRPRREVPRDGAGPLTDALGWFSLGLGLAQLVAPRGVARLVGAEPDDETSRLMRAFGLRELSSGLGILTQRRRDGWVRARVAGDVMDIAMLGRTLVSNKTNRGRTIAATAAVLGVTALDVLAARRLAEHGDGGSERVAVERGDTAAIQHVRRAITISRPPEEVAAFWRQYGGDEAMLDETVRFRRAPGGRGTEVHLDRRYKRPGRIAAVIATLRHDNPSQHAFDELFALKQILETGDVVTSDAWANGPHAPHPAQPEP